MVISTCQRLHCTHRQPIPPLISQGPSMGLFWNHGWGVSVVEQHSAGKIGVWNWWLWVTLSLAVAAWSFFVKKYQTLFYNQKLEYISWIIFITYMLSIKIVRKSETISSLSIMPWLIEQVITSQFLAFLNRNTFFKFVLTNLNLGISLNFCPLTKLKNSQLASRQDISIKILFIGYFQVLQKLKF